MANQNFPAGSRLRHPRVTNPSVPAVPVWDLPPHLAVSQFLIFHFYHFFLKKKQSNSMASFIKIRPILTEDLLLGPSHRRGARNVIPRESPMSLSQHQVTETEKEIRISLDVPGVKASDISVTTVVSSATAARRKRNQVFQNPSLWTTTLSIYPI